MLVFIEGLDGLGGFLIKGFQGFRNFRVSFVVMCRQICKGPVSGFCYGIAGGNEVSFFGLKVVLSYETFG